MKCPNCGAENEIEARFCVDCGAPLESQIGLPSKPPEFFDNDDTDRTILSGMGRIAEEAKTVAVTQDQLASAEAEAVSSSSRAPRLDSTPSYDSSSSSGGGFWTQRNIIIIAVVVVVLLLCCCCSLLIGAILADPEMLDDLSLRLLPAYLPYV